MTAKRKFELYKKMKAVVFAYHDMGYAGISVLLEKGVGIGAVFTYSNDPGENCWFKSVEDLCRERGLKYYLDADLKDPKWEDVVRALEPDAILSFYYRSLIPMRILRHAKHGAVNMHGSLLPKYRGRCPVNWQILNGEKTAGVTLHYMEAGADTGDIIAQTPVAIDEADTALSLFGKLELAGRKLLEENAAAIMAGTAPRIRQDNAQASVYGGRRPEDGRILPTMTTRQVYDLVRAVTRPYPGAFVEGADGKKTVIWKCRKAEGAKLSGGQEAAPGAFFVHNKARYIKTTDGAVEVLDASDG